MLVFGNNSDSSNTSNSNNSNSNTGNSNNSIDSHSKDSNSNDSNTSSSRNSQVLELEQLRRKVIDIGISAVGAPSRGLDYSFCLWTAGQGLAEKEWFFTDTGSIAPELLKRGTTMLAPDWAGLIRVLL